jgi:GT2 family glycosyltransferase
MNFIRSHQITAVISTRNRGERVAETVRSVLKNDYPHFVLVVIDQSEDDLTANAIGHFLKDPRFQYMRSLTRGLSAGRNVGIKSAQSELIALTDDDCEPPINWLKELAAAFALDRRIGVVFGNVEAAPHELAKGFIPTCIQTKPFLARRISEQYKSEGMSACMGIRRNLWESLGGFDEMLGAGSSFKAAEEMDFALRALSAGHFVYSTPEARVIHHGFRTWREGKRLIQAYLYGTGAAFAKQMKSRPGPTLSVLARIGRRWSFGHPPVRFGNRSFRGLRLTAFAKGFLRGLRNPVDRNSGHFLSPNLFSSWRG